MISKKVFKGDGYNQRFLSDFIIKSEQYARVYNYIYDPDKPDGTYDDQSGLYTRVKDIPDPLQDLVFLDKYDLIDNSIAFYVSPYQGSTVYIEVATTPEEFGETLTAPSVALAEYYKEMAYRWASYPEDKPVFDGIRLGYSAFNWAQKAKKEADSKDYYLRDGSLWLTGNLNAGFRQLGNVAQGTKSTDVMNKQQVETYTPGRIEFVDKTGGAIDANKPIKTTAKGTLDVTFLDLDAFNYVGPWTPTLADEYPQSGIYNPGDFFNIEGVDDTNGYTFQTGLLVGRVARNGYLLVRGKDREWIMRESTGVDPEMYYRIDGATPITAPFAAGGQQLKNLAPGVDLNDAVTVEQIQNLDLNDTFLRIYGGNTMMAALGLNGFKIVGLADGSADDDAATWGQARDYTDMLQTYVDQELDKRFEKSEFLIQSGGIGDSGKPVVLDSTGRLHPSFLDADALYFVGGFTPTPSVEYPSTGSETSGAYWLVQNVDINLGYTFTAGDLLGQTAKNGSLMMWGTSGWALLNDTINPNLYLRLDGSKPMQGNLNMDGYQIKAIAEGSDDQDVATYGQVRVKADQDDLDNHTGRTDNPHTTTAAQVGAPAGSWVWDGAVLEISI